MARRPLKSRDLFPDEAARAQLLASRLADFEALWALSADWHEAPNERRGGWSGVSRYRLDDGSAIFLKRQENHLCRTLRHPFRGIPTFYREYLNILRLHRHHVGAVEALYYGDRLAAGRWRAILATRALDNHLSLDDWNDDAAQIEQPQRQSLIAATAQACARLHHHRLQHSCLYGKHVFVSRRPDSNGLYQESDVRFIDLEKLRKGISGERVRRHDLDQLMRHTNGWNDDDWRIFRSAYRLQREALQRQGAIR
jgi:hypothetical protein